MSAKFQVYLIAFICIATGIGLTAYKNIELGFPLSPGEKRSVWTVEAKVQFQALGDPVQVSLALPEDNADTVIIDEEFTSPGYGFGWDTEQGQRRAEWAKLEAQGTQTLYYKLQFYQTPSRKQYVDAGPVRVGIAPEIDEAQTIAVHSLIKGIRERSANAKTFANELIRRINSKDDLQSIGVLLDSKGRKDKIETILGVLAYAEIPARKIAGLFLESGRKRQNLRSMIEVFSDGRWVVFNPETGETGVPENFVPWQRGGISLLDVVGGEKSSVSFSLIEDSRPAKALAIFEGENTQAALVDFSIYSLPIEVQNTFKHILLVPIGALVVVLLRVLIGIKTSGTFMPILMALAFIQTTLITGLTIFLVIVAIGLWIRSYLTQLNLLLVARISAVVIVVIALMAALSILSHKLGFGQALTVTFFPMIILAWTIERMSILWEEDGPKEVMLQGGGSLFVAVLAYLAMTNNLIEHLTFNFPELLLVLLGIIMLLGQYTGYRLTELRRFQPMVEDR